MGMKNLKDVIRNPVEDSIYEPFRGAVNASASTKDDSMGSVKWYGFYTLVGSLRYSIRHAVEDSIESIRNIWE